MPNENIEITVSDPKSVIYWQVQVDTLASLHAIGVHFDLNQRLPCFQIIRHLTKLLKEGLIPEHLILDAWSHVDRLVRYRTNGYEPPSEKDIYK